MHPFDPNMRYTFYAEAFEEDIMGWGPTDPLEFNQYVEDTADNYTFDECRKVLSELGLDYAVDDPRNELIAFYQADGMAEKVMSDWAKVWE